MRSPIGQHAAPAIHGSTTSTHYLFWREPLHNIEVRLTLVIRAGAMLPV
jgi:hypothetical protein